MPAHDRKARAPLTRPTARVLLVAPLVALAGLAGVVLAGLVVVGLVLVGLLLAPPASAASVTVTLRAAAAPSPGAARAEAGDSLVFRNADVLDHVVQAKSTNWQLSVTVPAEGSASYRLTRAGTFTYTDTRQLLMGVYTGSITVTAAPNTTPGQTAGPRPSLASPADGATPGPTASVVPGGATPGPTASVVPGGAQTTSRGRLTQGSTHRFGLPVLLAVVALVGVVTVLGRYLLAQPAAGGRRTWSGGSAEGVSTDPGDSSD